MPSEDINNPNAQEWLARNGIPVDDRGIPQFIGAPGPPQPCGLCSQLAETPVALVAGNRKCLVRIVICRDCVGKSYQDRRQFMVHLSEVIERMIADGNYEPIDEDDE